MLNESGNLIEEGIPITKDLLDFAKANNYKISLKTGDYRKEPMPTTRGQRYNKDLISMVHTIYYAGNLYLTDYFEVFGFNKLEGLMQAIKQCGFKLLSRKETQEIYGSKYFTAPKRPIWIPTGVKHLHKIPKWLSEVVKLAFENLRWITISNLQNSRNKGALPCWISIK